MLTSWFNESDFLPFVEEIMNLCIPGRGFLGSEDNSCQGYTFSSSKIPRARRLAEVVDHLPSKHEAPSSNPVQHNS
jgi:hypothetical protein